MVTPLIYYDPCQKLMRFWLKKQFIDLEVSCWFSIRTSLG